jgi:hypothetical protein
MARKQRAEVAQVKSERRRDARLVEPTLAAVDALGVDAVVAGLFSDVRPLSGALGMVDWRLCGRLSRMLQQGLITGDDGERVLVPTAGRIPAPRLLLYGWGRQASSTSSPLERVRAMVEMATRADCQRVAFALPEPAAELVVLVVDDVEKLLGARLSCFFAADPLPVA